MMKQEPRRERISTPHPRTREMRLRRAAARQGLELKRSRRRDPRALDFGAWWLVNPATGAIVAGDERTGMSLDAVEAVLNATPQRQRQS